MSLLRFLIPAAVVGVGFVALSSGEAHAAEASRQLSPAQAKEIEQALATADPRAIRELAAELSRAGFDEQASDLRKAADAIELAVKNVPPVKAGDKPRVGVGAGVITTTAEPITPKAGVPEPPSAQKLLAAKTALMLTNASPGRESKPLVTDYQLQEQSLQHTAVGKADGLYGPKTALTLAKFYGIVPPKPYYWPRNDRAGAKAAYRAELLALAAKDAPRAEEWRAAAAV